jgi:hypothetical protein
MEAHHLQTHPCREHLGMACADLRFANRRWCTKYRRHQVLNTSIRHQRTLDNLLSHVPAHALHSSLNTQNEHLMDIEVNKTLPYNSNVHLLVVFAVLLAFFLEACPLIL